MDSAAKIWVLGLLEPRCAVRSLGGLWESLQANYGDISPNCMRGEFLPAQAPHLLGVGVWMAVEN